MKIKLLYTFFLLLFLACDASVTPALPDPFFPPQTEDLYIHADISNAMISGFDARVTLYDNAFVSEQYDSYGGDPVLDAVVVVLDKTLTNNPDSSYYTESIYPADLAAPINLSVTHGEFSYTDTFVLPSKPQVAQDTITEDFYINDVTIQWSSSGSETPDYYEIYVSIFDTVDEEGLLIKVDASTFSYTFPKNTLKQGSPFSSIEIRAVREKAITGEGIHVLSRIRMIHDTEIMINQTPQ